MAITTGHTTMTSDQTGQHAEWARDPDGPGGAWVSSRLPERRLTRDQALASLVLAELEGTGWRDSPNAVQLRAELGIQAG